jgi:putative DNA mismatch repair protein
MNNPQNVRVGVQVRFLNAVGGGRVARITGDTAWVEDEDGFEIPTALKDCVVVDSEDTFIPAIRPPKAIQDKLRPSPPPTPQPAAPKREVQPSIPTDLPYTYLPDRGELFASLAFLPVDPTQLGLTNYEAYLINKSNYCLHFTYLSRVGAGSYKLRCSGTIEPNGDTFLEEFAPADLNDLEHLALQITPYDDHRSFRLVAPQLIELKLDGKKFFKQRSFVSNEFFEDDAFILPVLEGGQAVQELAIETKELEQALQSPAPKAKGHPQTEKGKATPHKPSTQAPLVIDLHAHELLETTTGMSSADIHQYQVEYFHRVMREHLGQKGIKIIFIHGKGDGVLRSSLERELKQRYRSCTYQDASFREYGFGATQVTIR